MERRSSTAPRGRIKGATGPVLLCIVAIGAFLLAPSIGSDHGSKVDRIPFGDHGAAAVAAPTPAADDDDKPVGTAAGKPTVRAGPHADEAASFVLDPQAQRAGGIAATPPRSAPLQATTRAYAAVPTLDGLTTLYNTALINAAALQTAKARAEAARVASARAQGVLKVFTTAKAQAEAAAATVAIDEGGLAGATAQDAALRNTAIGDWGDVLGRAIADRAPLATDLVQRRTTLVLVSVDAAIAGAMPAALAFTVDGRTITGHLVGRVPRVDPRLQLPGFYYTVPAQAGLAAGDTLATTVPGGTAQPGWQIPDTAIVWQNGRPWFYVREQATRFERHGVGDAAMPKPDGGFVVAGNSLEPDEAVVTAGAQLLLSQELHAQIPSDDD